MSNEKLLEAISYIDEYFIKNDRLYKKIGPSTVLCSIEHIEENDCGEPIIEVTSIYDELKAKFNENSLPKFDINTGIERLTKIPLFDNDIYIHKKKSLFKDFLKSKEYKKFRKNSIEKNNIYIKISDDIIGKVDIMLYIDDEHGRSSINTLTSISTDNLTVFVVEYIIRLCSLLLFLKYHKLDENNKDSFLSKDKYFNVEQYYTKYGPYKKDGKFYVYSGCDISVLYTKVKYSEFNFNLLDY